MKKRNFVPLLLIGLCMAPLHTHIPAQETELDLQTLIAGIKHYDAAISSGKMEISFNGLHVEGRRETYGFTFAGVTFEEAQVRTDFSTGRIATEIWDGERHWEIYRSKKLLFLVDISAEDYKLLKKEKPKLPLPIKEQLKTHRISISDNFRIEPDERNAYFIIIDNDTEDFHYIYYTEEQFGFYITQPEYGVRPKSIINAQLDPRYWMTYGKIVSNAYLMIPLWKLLETYEIETLQTETLNGKETYRIRVKYPHSESLTLWVSPKQGFRLVKLQRITKQSNTGEKSPQHKYERLLHYKEYQPDVWFPEKIEQIRYSLLGTAPQKRDGPTVRQTLQVIKFETNADVSASFQLDVPNDTLIYDYGTAKERSFGELKNSKQ